MTSADLAAAVPEEVLVQWLTGQRWFASKARDVVGLEVLASVPLRDDPPLLTILLVEARFGSGTHERYQLVLGGVPRDAPGDPAGLIHVAGDWDVDDALAQRGAAGELVRLMAAGGDVAGTDAGIRFSWREGAPGPPVAGSERAMGAEQSNTSVVLGERLAVKVFRRLEAGLNPELEMLRFLSAREFASIAQLDGWYEYVGEQMDATLGIAQRFVTGGRDGWELGLDALAAGDGDGAFVARLGELGAVTGQMHSVLASEATDPAFAPEDPSEEMLSLLSATIDEEIERVFVDLPDEPAVAPIAGRGQEVRDQLQLLSHIGAGGRMIRTHGDYHLGQTLLAPEGWVLLDFEGEPARPLSERRRKRSPLRDVAGMLRSFAYVASAAEILRSVAVPADWEPRARAAFLEGWQETVDPSLLPAGHGATDKLLSIFELEKAVYELRYELNNRPQWVGIPVAGIARLLEESA
jgi:maltokinase